MCIHHRSDDTNALFISLFASAETVMYGDFKFISINTSVVRRKTDSHQMICVIKLDSSVSVY